jgi:hypothetical protein
LRLVSKPTVVTLVLTGEEIVAAATVDPMGFVEARADAFDRAAQEFAAKDGRYAVSLGSAWGLLLPGVENDVASIEETYGPQVGAMLRQSLAAAPAPAVIAWRVMETIPRGRG